MNPPEHRPASAERLVESLNPAQREAVTHGDGPLLVLAGAGSGKTRVITHRIAWLVHERGVRPWNVVAVTFTNKAAGEMRSRVERMLGSRAEGMWIGTFHGLCLRMLRRDGERVGLAPGFVVYDSDDQLALVRRILKGLSTEDTGSAARPFLSKISRWKNAMTSPEAAAKTGFTPEARLQAEVYAAYEEGLARANAADFDDLLLKALRLVDPEECPEVHEKYASRTEHLLVDEYQDTNRPQYLLVRHLSATHRNVFVVGDEDQSIYKFRGAEIRNILDFERDYRDARTIKLEENYRSTGTILEAAGAVIANNLGRKGKSLWTRNVRGERLTAYAAVDDRDEASWIVARVQDLGAGRAHEDFAVLYRTNAQSRPLEEALRRERIPYQVVGAVQFYERKEVKDLLAYLKLAVNPADDVAFRRIVNVPPRGVGDTTIKVVEDVARGRAVSLLDAARHAVELSLLNPRSGRMLADFLDLVDGFRARAAEEPAPVVIDGVLDAIGYEAYLEKAYPGESDDRADNVRALVSAAAEYERDLEGGDEPPTLQGFLDRSALVSDADEVGASPGVTLMTIHNAKGLEFPVVFLAGMEENLFPHARSVGNDEDLEEERRLCYVAMTRARERLFLSHAFSRLVQGVPQANGPSRFLAEVPPAIVDLVRGRPSWDRDDAWEPKPAFGSSAARAAAKAPSPPAVSAKGEKPADGFAVGSTVRHPMFGAGKITEREGLGQNLKLTIWFQGHGKKRILPSYTRLEIV